MLDDLMATEHAACMHPNAPLSLASHAEEMLRILFTPELIVLPPIIQLLTDNTGIVQAEVQGLEHYHCLKTVIKVCSKDGMILMCCHCSTS